MILKRISPDELMNLIQKKSNISIIDIRELYELKNDGKFMGPIYGKYYKVDEITSPFI